VPSVESPFATLLDAADEEWSNPLVAKRLISKLLQAGCRYFVCFGNNSESIHDLIDDCIVDGDYEGVVTTFHDNESEEDVLSYFLHCAVLEMAGALVFVREVSRWETILEERSTSHKPGRYD